jgi:hypothetical protein
MLFSIFQGAQVSERENHPADANGSSGNNGASVAGGPSSSMEKRKHHEDMEPFKDVKRVSGIWVFLFRTAFLSV